MASATTRWRLLVDRVASLSCAACQVVVVSAAGRDDDQRLTGEVDKCRGLVHRPRSLEELVDVAFDGAGG